MAAEERGPAALVLQQQQVSSLIVCLAGVPGAGKSTLCSTLLARDPTILILAVDTVFDALLAASSVLASELTAEDTAALMHEAAASVRAACQVTATCKEVRTIIVDSTHHLSSMRKPFFQIARSRT